MSDPIATMDEIRRVALYWEQVRQLACEHPEIVSTPGQPWACSECDRPLRILSDVQIEHVSGQSRLAEVWQEGYDACELEGERKEYGLAINPYLLDGGSDAG